ncbi:hypothetical protein CU097_007218 [Rhizopus azygosporus]|uniref:Uncharacterized protein n=1 Tax=Rhizopus azygosporus TaxID=86630 RepID=A0A367JI04_RHIAZ|nr:hypothetical protein CU097_007218 [Rhizopus azygosporus]
MKTINNINGSMSAIIYTTPDSSIGHGILKAVDHHEYYYRKWRRATDAFKNVMVAQSPANTSPGETTGVPMATIHMTWVLLSCGDSTLRENNSYHKEDPL